MPWSTPTLKEIRSQVRDAIRGKLPGADANIPNSVLRVMSDAQGALCHLTLQYIDWLALQLLPDTAETEWLDRHGNIWLVNSDGTTGRKLSTLASGSVLLTGTPMTVVPANTQLSYSLELSYETTQLVTLGNGPTSVPVRALDPGMVGNQDAGTTLVVVTAVAGLDGIATVEVMTGGTDAETDDDLRARILRRIRQPPQGGAAYDYEAWALAVPGCTRAWVAPNEMGIGTVTVRVMFDILRADRDGFPLPEDIAAVTAYIDRVRPVAVKDFWVLSPIPQPIDFNLIGLTPDDAKGGVEKAIKDMLYDMSAPGQTIYAAWKYSAVMNAPGVIWFSTPDSHDDVMPSLGHIAVLGDIYYG